MTNDKETYVRLEDLVGGLDRLISYLQSEKEIIPENGGIDLLVLKDEYSKMEMVIDTLKKWVNEDLPKYKIYKEKT